VDSRNAAPGGDGMSVSSSSVETHMGSEAISKRIDGMVLGGNTKTQRKKTSKTQSKMLLEGGR
jgi:RNA polymerase II-associated protein 2